MGVHQRLLNAVDKNGPGGCWLWLNCRSDKGYGVTKVRYKHWRAHRLSYFLSTGDLPDVVRHKCDNPPCVNPDHLLGGSQKENIHDMIERGRDRFGGGPNKCGHERSAATDYTAPSGYRQCRKCRSSNHQKYQMCRKYARLALRWKLHNCA